MCDSSSRESDCDSPRVNKCMKYQQNFSFKDSQKTVFLCKDCQHVRVECSCRYLKDSYGSQLSSGTHKSYLASAVNLGGSRASVESSKQSSGKSLLSSSSMSTAIYAVCAIVCVLSPSGEYSKN
jgi:hypothetical protein